MLQLKDLSERNQIWNLDEFVAQANALLPYYLPEDGSASRVREEVNVRLIRHYTSLGMLSQPLRTGREVRYEYRHLLQLLVVRRLLASGYGASAIDDLALNRTNEELTAILEGGAEITITPANPALAQVDSIRSRTRHAAAKLGIPAPAAVPTQRSTDSRWTRFEILPGIELHVNDSFSVPKSRKEQENLLQVINQKLIQIHQRRDK
jgi:DNA-binding transcriptional MerR regulator